MGFNSRSSYVRSKRERTFSHTSTYTTISWFFIFRFPSRIAHFFLNYYVLTILYDFLFFYYFLILPYTLLHCIKKQYSKLSFWSLSSFHFFHSDLLSHFILFFAYVRIQVLSVLSSNRNVPLHVALKYIQRTYKVHMTVLTP